MQKIFATENKDPRDIQNKNVKTSADKSVKILKSPALKKYQEIGDKAGD